ncbi:MAG: PQQ-dependent sugar dehydrogenase [Casimicrobiaceae bacterium]
MQSIWQTGISYGSHRCVAGTLAGCNWLANLREEKKGIQLDRLSAPAGYKTSVLTRDVPKARQMVLGNRGTLFVGSNAGKVHALTLDGNRVVKARTLATGLNDGSGVAFHNGALFYSDRTKILRMDDIENRLDNPPAPVTVVDGLPSEERHGALFMMIGPDNKLYISVGSPCNVCEAPKDEFGHVLRVNPDGSGREIFARGIRNTVGFDFHPQTRDLWFTENGQDDLGNERPNDELNRVSKVGELYRVARN